MNGWITMGELENMLKNNPNFITQEHETEKVSKGGAIDTYWSAESKNKRVKIEFNLIRGRDEGYFGFYNDSYTESVHVEIDNNWISDKGNNNKKIISENLYGKIIDASEKTIPVQEAFENASKIQMGENNYQDIMVNQRVEGPTNAGSSYNMTADEIKNMIRTSEWSEVFDNPNVGEGCRLFKADVPGLNGIVDIKQLPNYKDLAYYAIDPKGTGNISIGVGNVPKKEESETYLIVGPEEINGKTEQVVYTFHPGEPVRPSMVEAKDIPDGTKLSYEKVKELGFDKAKFMSDDMVKEYDKKAAEQAASKGSTKNIIESAHVKEILQKKQSSKASDSIQSPNADKDTIDDKDTL